MMTKRLSFLTAAALCLGSTSTWAQPAKTDLDVYRDAKTQYDLGDFTKAIELFKEAYSMANKPAYLFNIGFSYEQLNDCEHALFFFQRFMKRATDSSATKPLDAQTRADVESRIAKAETCVKDRGSKPIVSDSDEPDEPDDKKPVEVAVVTPPETDPEVDEPEECIDGDEAACETDSSVTTAPRLIVARLAGGAGLVVNAGPLSVPPQFTGALTLGYPLTIGDKLVIEVGAGFVFTPVPYTKMPSNESGSAAMTSLLANVGVTYAVTPKIGIHGDLGLGVLLFSGLEEGNPFTMNAQPATAPLTMFNVRAGVTAEYSFTPSISAFLTPIAFSFSPVNSYIREDISALTKLEFMVGIGFRK